MSGTGPPWVVRVFCRRDGGQACTEAPCWDLEGSGSPQWALTCTVGTHMVRAERTTGSSHKRVRQCPGCPRKPVGELNLKASKKGKRVQPDWGSQDNVHPRLPSYMTPIHSLHRLLLMMMGMVAALWSLQRTIMNK